MLEKKILKTQTAPTINCPGDADSTIIKTALDMTSTGWGHVTVVTDDTDIAVTLFTIGKATCLTFTSFKRDGIKLGVSRMPVRKVKTSNNTCFLSMYGLVVTLLRLCLGKGKQDWPKTSRTKNGNNYQK